MPLTTRHQCRSQQHCQNGDDDDQAESNYTDEDNDENAHAVTLCNDPVGADNTDTVAHANALSVIARGDIITSANDVERDRSDVEVHLQRR